MSSSTPDPDAQFFVDHPDRRTHIRPPKPTLHHDPRTHEVRYLDECEAEFRSLGLHEKNRRRIILTRVNVMGVPLEDNHVLKIPMLLFADETVEDRDDILLPIIDQIMREAGQNTSLYGSG